MCQVCDVVAVHDSDHVIPRGSQMPFLRGAWTLGKIAFLLGIHRRSMELC